MHCFQLSWKKSQLELSGIVVGSICCQGSQTVLNDRKGVEVGDPWEAVSRLRYRGWRPDQSTYTIADGIVGPGWCLVPPEV